MLLKKTIQRAKLKIMLSDAFSFAMWSTIPPMPLKAILDPLKCQIEAFYYINQKPHLSSQTSWGTNEKNHDNKIQINIEVYLFTVFVLFPISFYLILLLYLPSPSQLHSTNCRIVPQHTF